LFVEEAGEKIRDLQKKGRVLAQQGQATFPRKLVDQPCSQYRSAIHWNSAEVDIHTFRFSCSNSSLLPRGFTFSLRKDTQLIAFSIGQ
jgi:hypothetical protein